MIFYDCLSMKRCLTEVENLPNGLIHKNGQAPEQSRAARIALSAGLTLLLLLYSSIAYGSERDIHYTAVNVLGQLSGMNRKDALLIARASQSMDENAETSPLPEKFQNKSPMWYIRTSKWHSLPTWSKGLLPNKYAQRAVDEQLVNLYNRAKSEKNTRKANIYFGQYLHALADSVAHKGFYNVIGHGLKGHTPDVPVAEHRNKTKRIVNLIVGSFARFQRDRLEKTPKHIRAEEIGKVVNALTYAAPSDEMPLRTREEIVYQQLERAFPGINVPRWAAVGPLVYNQHGDERQGNLHPPRDIDMLLSLITPPEEITRYGKQELALARNDKTLIEARIGELEQEETNAKKELRLCNDQELRVTKAVELELKAYLVEEKIYDAKLSKHEEARRRVEVNCKGTLSRPTYQRCLGEKQALDRWKGKLDAKRDALDLTNKSIRDRIKPVCEGKQNAKKKLENAQKELSKLRGYLKGWNAHIRGLRRKLKDACTQATTCEALKHCRSIRWDGPPPKLPPLATDSPC